MDPRDYARKSPSGLDGSPVGRTDAAHGYSVHMRMNDYVGPGIYAWLTWGVPCTREGGAHSFGLLSQECVVCHAKPAIEYDEVSR